MKDLSEIRLELSNAEVHVNPLLKEIVDEYKILSTAFDLAHAGSTKSIEEIYITVNINDDLNPFENSYNQLEILCNVDGEEKRFARKLNTSIPFSPLDVILTSYFAAPSINDDVIKATRKDGYKDVNISDILFIKANNNKSFFILGNSEVVYSDSKIGDYENLLVNNADFERVHESYIVNLTKVVGRAEHTNLLIYVPERMDVDKIFSSIKKSTKSRQLRKDMKFFDSEFEKKQFKIPIGKDSIDSIQEKIDKAKYKKN